MIALPICFFKEDKIAIIAPHPDDECIGVGGVMALYPGQCDVYVVTDGRQGNKGVKPEIEAIIRRRQFEKELECVKIHDAFWMGYEDGTLMIHPNNFLSSIDFSSYTKIFIPWGDDNHPDHTAVYSCAMKYFFEKCIKAEIYMYEVHVPFHDVTNYVDISSVIEKKYEMISCHKDQVESYPYHEIAKSLGKYRACQGNKVEAYWETFFRVDILEINTGGEMIEREKILQKYQTFNRTLINWVSMHQHRKSINDYLKNKAWSRVSIYGYATLGRLLYKELKDVGNIIENILDIRELPPVDDKIPVLRPEMGNNKIDVVIVTAVTHYEKIKSDLEELGYKNIISLEKILEEYK